MRRLLWQKHAVSVMQTELDSCSEDLAKRQQLELQVDTASREVQHLQGQLADLNAVLSNHVNSTKLEALHDQHAKLSASNHAERQRVDAVYANRAAKQRQIKEVQATAEQIQKQLEQKVHKMSIEQQQEYYNLQVLALPSTHCLDSLKMHTIACIGQHPVDSVDFGV